MLLLPLVALAASLLTFVSGFGLGTLLLPAIALFLPLPEAVAITAVVHLLNNVFKFGLMRGHVHRPTLWAFGIPAIAAAFAGAWLLGRLDGLAPLYTGARHAVGPLQVIIALLMALFALLELSPTLRELRAGPRWRVAGGVVSGFFGGLSGHQGALRSLFLLHGGLGREAFVATGTAIALLVDLTRIPVYLTGLDASLLRERAGLLTACTAAAFAGAWWGRRMLPKLTHRSVQLAVAALLLGIAAGLLAGVL